MISNSEFNQKLIELIAKYIPSKSEQLDLLMDITNMSKEAAYRRLRGDVPFSFSEACLVSQRLGMSLDDIAMSGVKGKLVFELRMHPNDLLDYNYQKLYGYEDSYDTRLSHATHIMTAWNNIPYSLFFPYENLSKIYIFKWLYQTREKGAPVKFSELILPEDVKNKIADLGQRAFPDIECTYILERSLFSTFLIEIKHFHSLGLIGNDDMIVLKEELLVLIADLEYMAVHGRTKMGSPIWLYLSNIDFDHNYTYVKGKDFEQAYMDNIYLMDTIISTNPEICKMHQNWIESLRKYSTLISISGERERKLFFDEQKQLIRDLI